MQPEEFVRNESDKARRQREVEARRRSAAAAAQADIKRSRTWDELNVKIAQAVDYLYRCGWPTGKYSTGKGSTGYPTYTEVGDMFVQIDGEDKLAYRLLHNTVEFGRDRESSEIGELILLASGTLAYVPYVDEDGARGAVRDFLYGEDIYISCRGYGGYKQRNVLFPAEGPKAYLETNVFKCLEELMNRAGHWYTNGERGDFIPKK